MFLVPIALNVVILDPVHFFGWVVLSCIYTDAVLHYIVNKLQCSIFHTKQL